MTVQVDAEQLARLKLARAQGKRFALAQHRVGSSLVGSPGLPVAGEDFVRVGHAFIGILLAVLGGLTGLYLYSSRDLPSGGVS